MDWQAGLDSAAYPVPFQQSFTYGEVMRAYGATAHRVLVKEGEETIALAQVITRTRWFNRIAFLPYGPVWLAPLSAEQKQQIYSKIMSTIPLTKRHLWLISDSHATRCDGKDPHWSILSDEDTTCAMFRKLGLRRVMTGDHQAWIDLSISIDALWQHMEGSNRTAIRKAEKLGITISEEHDDYRWLLEAERQQRQEKSYLSLPIDFPLLYQNLSTPTEKKGTIIILKASTNHQTVAGILLLIQGTSATYYLSWNSREGRALQAKHLLLWEAMQLLKKRGVHWFDLGTVETTSAEGIAYFKRSFGAFTLRHAGTFWKR